jgi:hypothetical protein
MSSWGTSGRPRILTQFPVLAWAKGGTGGVALLVAVFALIAVIVLRGAARAWGPEVRAWAGFYPLFIVSATALGSSTIRHLLLAFPLMWPFPDVVPSTSVRRRRLGMIAILATCGLLTQWVWISQVLVVTHPPVGPPFP